MMLAGLGVCMALGTPVKGMAVLRSVETAEGKIATASDASGKIAVFAADDEIWGADVGDMSFLSGRSGDGSKEKPYQLMTKEHLIGLAVLASMGMEIGSGEGTYPGNYRGAWFELGKNIDLSGMNWIPIGFYRTGADMRAGKVSPFEGHFDGNGKTVSNFRMYQPSWDFGGLFGMVENAEITDLKVKPGHVITVKENGGILAGRAKHSVIRNVTVNGTLRTTGTVGGVTADVLEDSVVENCVSDHVAIDAGSGKEIFIGGIAGRASESLIADCEVNTGDSLSARIQGGGYVGGIAGFQNSADIFNSHVMGTIGGSGAQSIGGITGKYASGKIKVARFEGTIASSGLGSAAREGTFIGTHDTGFHFRYGAEAGADAAYLFADTEEKIAAGVCGSGVSDDNRFSYDAHIGFWNKGDNFYTLVQGQNVKKEDELYFYEELENGVLHVVDTEDAARQGLYTPDHFAPNSVGRPVRGYLLSVLQVDTAANSENFYDVAVLTAKGSSAYSKEFHKAYRGAVVAGDTVTVLTAPRNTETEKFQMDGVPTYTDSLGRRRKTSYQTGGSYQFVMPEHDTEVSAVYKKVAAGVRVEPQEFAFRVTEERTGDRMNPSITTEVRDSAGKLLARYLNGKPEAGTKVQDVKIQAVVDKNNDVADEAVRWSVDDDELILLKKNDDEDESGYTKKSASIELNLNAGFFKDIVGKAEAEQAKKQYRYPIEDTIYGNGIQGGLAVLTAKTRPVSSFEEKSVTANCRIPVTFQIKDRTKVAAEGASLNKTALNFTVTRKLTGDRKNPQETLTVSAPQILSGTFAPDYFDKKDINWTVGDHAIIQMDAGFVEEGIADGDYRNAKVSAKKDTRWILDLMEADDAAHAEHIYEKRTGYGTRSTDVIMAAKDALGNIQSAACSVKVDFVTDDQTVVMPEEIRADQDTLTFALTLTKSGSRYNPVLSWEGSDAQKITAELVPEAALKGNGDGNFVLEWRSRSGAVKAENGVISADTGASWITEAMKKYPYTAETTDEITVKAGTIEKKIPVKLTFKLVDRTWLGSSGGHSSGSGSTGSVLKKLQNTGEQPKGSIAGEWRKEADGSWRFVSGGKTYAGEWAWIYNPYAKEGQEKTSWFHFASDGRMQTGWFLDEKDGSWYYLRKTSDGNQGKMQTGWLKEGEKWYYLGPTGRMTKGWNWIDGKCYYMDQKNGHMLAGCMTPDGYTVDDTGAWCVHGVVQTFGKK